MDIRIEKATLADADVAGRISSASWKSAYKGIVPDWFLAGITPSVRAERFRTVLAEKPDVEFFLISVDTIPAGILNQHPCGDGNAAICGEVGVFYFLPDCRGCGCAAPAMEFALCRLRERGFSSVALWVLEDNARARRFYEKCGFSPDGAKKTVNLGKELTEVRYRKSIFD
jgi:GNAT superfamily N-acetyltransferase